MSATSKTYESLSKIGARLGLTKQAVSKAAKRNAIPKNDQGKVALEDVTAALRAEQSERTTSTKTAETNAVLKQKLSLLKIEAAEIEVSKAKGSLVAVRDVRSELARLIEDAKTILLSIPSKLAPQVVGLSVPEAEQLIREQIYEALTTLSEGKY